MEKARRAPGRPSDGRPWGGAHSWAAPWRPPIWRCARRWGWPGIGELAADYRTARGEQRRLTLGDALDVQMNTLTRINVTVGADGAKLIELADGEAEVRAGAEPLWWSRAPAGSWPATPVSTCATSTARRGCAACREWCA